MAEENAKLREEIERLKEADNREQSRKERGATDSPLNNERVSGGGVASATYTVTAYTANEESTDKSEGHPAYGITASGKPAQTGVTVACPPDIPFGTRLDIEGVGERVCFDRGSLITSGHLDVYMPELADAREFGRQTLRVRIIK